MEGCMRIFLILISIFYTANVLSAKRVYAEAFPEQEAVPAAPVVVEEVIVAPAIPVQNEYENILDVVFNGVNNNTVIKDFYSNLQNRQLNSNIYGLIRSYEAVISEVKQALTAVKNIFLNWHKSAVQSGARNNVEAKAFLEKIALGLVPIGAMILDLQRSYAAFSRSYRPFINKMPANLKRDLGGLRSKLIDLNNFNLAVGQLIITKFGELQ